MRSLQVLMLTLSTLVGFNSVRAAEPISYTPPPNVTDVERLVRAGVNEDVLMAFVDTTDTPYELTADDIRRLRSEGVSDAVIVEMVDHGKFLDGDTSVTPVSSDPNFASDATQPDAPPADVTVPPSSDMNVSFFYDALSPHGTWHNDPTYGYVWQPNVEVTQPDWRPYDQGGRWTYTDQGWYFSSDYQWSWAAFHYGRWTRTPSLSWVWVPGTDWAPSWVTWRQTGDSYGWAPLPPEANFQPGIGFTYRGNSVRAGFDFGLGCNDFNFVHADRFLSPNLDREVLRGTQVTNIYNKSVTINNTYIVNNNGIVNNGIPVNTVAVATQQTIRPVRIETAVASTGQAIPHEAQHNGAIQAFRPTISPRAPLTPEVVAQRRQERVAATAAKVEARKQAQAAAHDRVQQEIVKRQAAAAQQKAQTQAKAEARVNLQQQKKQETAQRQQQQAQARIATQQANQQKQAEARKAAQEKAAVKSAAQSEAHTQALQQRQEARAVQTQKVEAQRQATQAKAAEQATARANQQAQRAQQAQQQQQARAEKTAATQQKQEAQRQAAQAKAAEQANARAAQQAQRAQEQQARAAATQQKTEARREAAQAKAAEQAAARAEKAAQKKDQKQG